MAENKNTGRTMRSDPPSHPKEILRTGRAGCMESIRNRKGVSDNIALELPDPDALHPSSESALEFKSEIGGQKTFTPSNASAQLISLDTPPAGEEMTLMDFQTPAIQESGTMVSSFGMVSSEPVVKAVQRKVIIKRMTALEINNHFSDLIDMMDGELAVEDPHEPKPHFYTIQRDANRRPLAERIPLNASANQIRQVMKERVRRLSGIPVTPLLKETLKEELRQLLFELIELGLIEKADA